MQDQLAFDEEPEAVDIEPRASAAQPRLLLTIREAARALEIGRSTAYELIAAGELEVVHIGRSSRVPIDALSDYVRRLRAKRP